MLGTILSDDNITMNEIEKKPSQIKRPIQFSVNKKQPSKLSNNPNILKNMAEYQQERIAESKPFTKLLNQKNIAKISAEHNVQSSPTPSPSQAKRYSTVQQDSKQLQQKSSTKQTFNQRLNHNIIKDQEVTQNNPSSKQSFRIKKVDSRSPKKMRDDLIVVNQQEYKLQKEIVELHKKYKPQLDKIFKAYQIPLRNISNFISEKQSEGKQSRISQQLSDDVVMHQLNQLLKAKQKAMNKHERKAAENVFYQYVLSHPLENNPIPEISSSQEDDVVEELPNDKPRLTSNAGSYSTSMPGIRNKHYALNMRRTYDVFKENDSQGQRQKLEVKQLDVAKEQISIKEGENKLTLNQKYRDFLLQ